MPRIKEDITHTLEIKKSRFITYLHRTESEEDARDFIKFIQEKTSGCHSPLHSLDHR